METRKNNRGWKRRKGRSVSGKGLQQRCFPWLSRVDNVESKLAGEAQAIRITTGNGFAEDGPGITDCNRALSLWHRTSWGSTAVNQRRGTEQSEIMSAADHTCTQYPWKACDFSTATPSGNGMHCNILKWNMSSDIFATCNDMWEHIELIVAFSYYDIWNKIHFCEIYS